VSLFHKLHAQKQKTQIRVYELIPNQLQARSLRNR